MNQDHVKLSVYRRVGRYPNSLRASTSPLNWPDHLKERILVEKLLPKHYRRVIETTIFEDKAGTHAPWTD